MVRSAVSMFDDFLLDVNANLLRDLLGLGCDGWEHQLAGNKCLRGY